MKYKSALASLKLVSVATLVIACVDAPPTDPVAGAPSETRGVGIPRNGLVLRSNYPKISNEGQFRALIAAVKAQANAEVGHTRRGSGLNFSLESNCGAASTLNVDPSSLERRGDETTPQSLGGFQIWARPDYPWPTSSSEPWGQWGIFFPIPGRFIPDVCQGWRYGSFGSTEAGAIGTGFGDEDGYDNAPSYPPTDDMDMNEFFSLNAAERKLVWAAFLRMSPVEFSAFVVLMREIRAEAETWAAQNEPIGAEDGPQDAMRHSYWQCRMTQAFGADVAKEFGDAHEKYSNDAAASRMDLVNNSHGRKIASKIGTTFSSCAEGVLDARNAEILQLTKEPPPSWTSPISPQPPPPPIDQ